MLTMEKAQRILAEFEGLTYREALIVMDKIKEEYEASSRQIVFTQEHAQRAAELVANRKGWEMPLRACVPAQTSMSL